MPETTPAVIVIDHGSRREESNAMLLEVVALFREVGGWAMGEATDVELAEPSLATAFARCAEQGARRGVVHPLFLLPGRHWSEDIPRLAAEAAENHPGLEFLVTAPLGVHGLLAELMQVRIAQCLAHAGGDGPDCSLCRESGLCRWRGGEPG